MKKLGVTPQDKYYLSWMTQRLANRAPDWTKARMWSWSILQQLLNPIATDLERVNKQLVEERDNIFLSATNIFLADRAYVMELGIGMEFYPNDTGDGVVTYDPPAVQAYIDDEYCSLTMAKHNNIESLFYSPPPSRIEDSETSYAYQEVVPTTTIADLSDVSPNELTVDGHLFITIENNTTWENRSRTRIYYPKVFIRGITRKGTLQEESVPVRYNGTFKTINQWQTVDDIFVSYLDAEATITVECLPFARQTQLDTSNLIVPASGTESWRFVRLGENNFGSTLVSEGFTVSDFNTIRKGFDQLDHEYEIELQDGLGNPLNLLGIALKPHCDLAFVINENNLYVYNTKLPYPDLSSLGDDHPDTKMDVFSNRWIYKRGDIARLETDTLDVTSVPWKIRWHLKEPDGTESYLLSDGTKLPTSSDAWIDNHEYENGVWKEHWVDIEVDQTGVHEITLETFYSQINDANSSYTHTTKFVYYVPAATPEIVIPLSNSLQNCSKLSFDSDGRLWFYNEDGIYLADVFYDYFLVDYEMRKVFLREDYSKVKVVL